MWNYNKSEWIEFNLIVELIELINFTFLQYAFHFDFQVKIPVPSKVKSKSSLLQLTWNLEGFE